MGATACSLGFLTFRKSWAVSSYCPAGCTVLLPPWQMKVERVRSQAFLSFHLPSASLRWIRVFRGNLWQPDTRSDSSNQEEVTQGSHVSCRFAAGGRRMKEYEDSITALDESSLPWRG